MLKRIFIMLFVGVLCGCATVSKQADTPLPLPLSVTYNDQVQEYKHEIMKDYAYRSIETSQREINKSKQVSQKQVKLSFKQIQQALKNAGFYKGRIDGKIGPKTKNAIIKFQKIKGLRVDGIVGKRTSFELNKFLIR